MAIPNDISRCILLVPPGAEPEPSLHARLDTRGWSVTVVDDPCLAMSVLCLDQRAEVARSAWGLLPNGQVALLLRVSGDDAVTTQLRPLVDAVRRYVPSTLILTGLGLDGRHAAVHAPAGHAPLGPPAEDEPPAPVAPGAGSTPAGTPTSPDAPFEDEPDTAPPLRLEPPRSRFSLPKTEPEDDELSVCVTAEELAMLFGASPDEGRIP